MRLFLLLSSLFFAFVIHGQNVNYNARITQFRALTNCGSDSFGGQDHTWFGFISDNNPTETSSGCRQKDSNGPTTLSGNFAFRNRINSTATFVRGRIDAWENDAGSRCSWESGDDCREVTSDMRNFTDVLEYSTTAETFDVGGPDYEMTVSYDYRYATTTLSEALDVFGGASFSTSGDRPFWGAMGSWGFIGQDCAASGTISDGESSSLIYYSDCESSVSFRWRVSSQSNADWLEFYLDGELIDRISGEVAWTEFTYDMIPDNDRDTLEWRYVKDGSISEGLDRGFIDFFQRNNQSPIDPGIIAGDQTIAPGDDPDPLTILDDGGSYAAFSSFQWQQSLDNSNWFYLSGEATAPDLGSLFQTTYYRRRIADNCGVSGTQDAFTNVVTITVDASLPVELDYLEAKQTAVNINRISWQTLTEVDNAYFSLERSTDGGNHFETIGRVLGVGNSRTAQTYEYLDRNFPGVRTLYYRLKQVDLDGSYQYSRVVSLQLDKLVTDLSVFPNPANNLLNFRVNIQGVGNGHLLLSDLQGRVVRQMTLDGQGGALAGRINVGDLSAGVYALQLHSDQGEMLHRQRVVVSR